MSTTLKIEAGKRDDYLPLSSKAIFWLRALFCYTIRILCILIFLGPFLGLMGSLSHWKAEQRPLDVDTYRSHQNWTFKDPNGNDKTLPLSTLHRANYTNPENIIPPPYTAYTIIPLHTAFALLNLLLLLQCATSIAIKKKFSVPFQDATWTSKLQHIIETLNMPRWYVDWDEIWGSPEEHRERFWKVFVETVALIGVQLAANLLLLTPLWITGDIHLFLIHVSQGTK